MANKQYESGYKSFAPTDVHEVDMDRRADWEETDELNPSFILHKPVIEVSTIPDPPAKAAADKTYMLKVSSGGSITWVEYTAPASNS